MKETDYGFASEFILEASYETIMDIHSSGDSYYYIGKSKPPF